MILETCGNKSPTSVFHHPCAPLDSTELQDLSTPQLDGVGPRFLVLGFLGQHCRTVLAHESERPSTHLATSPINCQTSCIICSRYHGIFGLFSCQDLFPHFQFEDRHYHHSLGLSSTRRCSHFAACVLFQCPCDRAGSSPTGCFTPCVASVHWKAPLL